MSTPTPGTGKPFGSTIAQLPPTMPRPEARPSAAQRRAEAQNPNGLHIDDLERALGINNPPPPQIGVKKHWYK